MNLKLFGRLRDNLTALAANAVADNITALIAINDNEANINAVAANEANITTVADNQANINAVDANEANINAVAGNEADIDIIVSNLTDIQNAANIVQALQANRPEQYSRIEAIKTNNSRGTGNQWEDAEVLAKNVRLRSVSDFNDLLFVDSISVNVNIVDNLLVSAFFATTGLSYVYVAYDQVADSLVYYCCAFGYNDIAAVNLNFPANITHVAFLGAFLVDDEGSVMTNRDLLVNRAYNDVNTISVTGVDLPISFGFNISALPFLPGTYEGVMEMYKQSGDSPTLAFVTFDFNDTRIFSLSTSDRYLLQVSERARYPVKFTSSGNTLTGDIPSEMGSTGTFGLDLRVEKISLEPIGYLV